MKKTLFFIIILFISCSKKSEIYNESNTNYINFKSKSFLPPLRKNIFNLIGCPYSIDFERYKDVSSEVLTEDEYKSFFFKIDTLAYCRNFKTLAMKTSNEKFEYISPKIINSNGNAIGKIKIYKNVYGYLLKSRFKNSETQSIYLFICKDRQICSVACLTYWSITEDGINNSYRTFFINSNRFVCISVVKTKSFRKTKNKLYNIISHYSTFYIDKSGNINCTDARDSRTDQIIDSIPYWKNVQIFRHM